MGGVWINYTTGTAVTPPHQENIKNRKYWKTPWLSTTAKITATQPQTRAVRSRFLLERFRRANNSVSHFHYTAVLLLLLLLRISQPANAELRAGDEPGSRSTPTRVKSEQRLRLVSDATLQLLEGRLPNHMPARTESGTKTRTNRSSKESDASAKHIC